jgi:hypothetical protein
MTPSLRQIASNLRRWTVPELVELLASVLALLIVVRVFGTFANEIELRPGIVLHDPVLARLTPRDMTGVIFAAIYLSVVVAFFIGRKKRQTAEATSDPE